MSIVPVRDILRPQIDVVQPAKAFGRVFQVVWRVIAELDVGKSVLINNGKQIKRRVYPYGVFEAVGFDVRSLK